MIQLDSLLYTALEYHRRQNQEFNIVSQGDYQNYFAVKLAHNKESTHLLDIFMRSYAHNLILYNA